MNTVWNSILLTATEAKAAQGFELTPLSALLLILLGIICSRLSTIWKEKKETQQKSAPKKNPGGK